MLPTDSTPQKKEKRRRRVLDYYNIIKTIVISEKSTDIQENLNQYVFKVDRRANKTQIIQAINKIFNINPVSVNTANYKGKKKRYRMKKQGRRSHWKKAFVKLKKDDSFDIL